METGSRVNPLLTLNYMQQKHENKYFDRKSAQIRVAELAPLISAFANADGGTIVLGISDKRRTLEGVNSVGEDKINDFINAPKDLCKPMPRYKEEFVDITNDKGDPDRLLLLHIMSSDRQIIRTNNDETWLRIGDRTKQMLGDNLRNLEYDKGARNFEDEVCPYATVEDLDPELLNRYKERIGAAGLDDRQVLRARGFLLMHDGKEQLINASVLLFAKNELQFPLNCRIRFIRIDGREMHVGADYNVVKDKSIDEPILRLIDDAKAYISDQLREFTHQDRVSGRFIETPEYPEFPWYEGIINAVAHRDWAATGQFIKVSMYDDRLEIESPGRFPDIVTADNISYTRFSRNKKISRVMTEFEWVRELNEGVKKIYSDMQDAGLPAPEYIEGPNTVRLILRNNIDERMPHRNKISENPSDERLNDGLADVSKKFEGIWDQLDDVEKEILKNLQSHSEMNRAELAEALNKSGRTISRKLGHLVEIGLVSIEGSKYDKAHTYSLKEH